MRATGESLLNAQISRLLTSPRQIHFEILTNIFDNLDKYILKSRQIHLIIWTNRFDNMDKQEWTGESLLNAANATPADIVGCSFIQLIVHCTLCIEILPQIWGSSRWKCAAGSGRERGASVSSRQLILLSPLHTRRCHRAGAAAAGAVRTGRLSPPPLSRPPPPPLSRLPSLDPTLPPPPLPTLATGTLNMPQLFSDSPYTSKYIANHLLIQINFTPLNSNNPDPGASNAISKRISNAIRNIILLIWFPRDSWGIIGDAKKFNEIAKIVLSHGDGVEGLHWRLPCILEIPPDSFGFLRFLAIPIDYLSFLED